VTDRIEWGFAGTQEMLVSKVENGRNGSRPVSQNPLLNYFAAQVRNVVDAVRGKDAVRVPGTDARKVIALIEQCYANRGLLSMEWLPEAQYRHATELANVQ
jgi:hypothetical protein